MSGVLSAFKIKESRVISNLDFSVLFLRMAIRYIRHLQYLIEMGPDYESILYSSGNILQSSSYAPYHLYPPSSTEMEAVQYDPSTNSLSTYTM